MLANLGIDGLAPAMMVSLCAAVFATAGLLVVWRYNRWAQKNRGFFSSFAAGVLIITALRLIPEGYGITNSAVFLVPIGYLGFYLLNTFFTDCDCHLGKVIAPLIAISLHSFIDGLEYGVLFAHDDYVGWTASIGLLAHEFAEGVILFMILREANLSSLSAFLLAFVGAALTTPTGTWFATQILPHADPSTLGILISLAAGALLYVGTTHLIGSMNATERRRTLPAFCVGFILAMGINFTHDRTADTQMGTLPKTLTDPAHAPDTQP